MPVNRRFLPLMTVLAVAALPAVARANAYTSVLHAYERTGSIPACSFSSRELDDARKQEDTYAAEYFADFTAAIQTALEARASGQCSAGGNAASVAAASASPVGPQHLGSVTSATGSGVPAPIVLMAVIALGAALVAAGAGVAYLRGWDPAWVAAWRHACDESGYRIGAIWAEFTDWIHASDRRRSV
jgi:hypothetical protein